MASILNTSLYTIPRYEWLLKHLIAIPRSRWYYQLKASRELDEDSLQRIMKYKFDAILPNHHAIYYNRDIRSKTQHYDVCRPDFLLWDADYTTWYVVEVELENHRPRHIEKQLRTFYEGDYSDVVGISAYVKGKFPNLDVPRFQALIQKRPRLILMADHISCEWREEFSKYNCLYSTLQAYSDSDDHFVYRFSGEFPLEVVSKSYASLNKHIRALDVHSPAFLKNLGYSDGARILVYYQGEIDEWDYLDSGGDEQLVLVGDVMRMDISQRRWRLVVNHRNELHLTK